MGSGNHLADQSDRERERKGQCSCGGSWKEIAWCAELNQPCEESIHCKELGNACRKETRLECQRCAKVVEAE